MDRITICETCQAGLEGPRQGAALAEALRSRLDQAPGVRAEVVLGGCMNVCGRPITVAFRAPGKAAYLFAGVDPEKHLDGLQAFAALYAGAERGEIADARPCGDLRFCLIGRIPA